MQMTIVLAGFGVVLLAIIVLIVLVLKSRSAHPTLRHQMICCH